ncbi:hypothetical protein [Arthrobacter sp. OY3WO11]|uniref:hypothetical protein n=1 Tax=Arthrobacter sp. OY3WO11 TaxID=1835723 RepID=UPI0007CFE399|nr:hypothetical protein [Arthrobacter sp. OY3WO11]OAE01852.1 hypothetical protein A6A22_10820 [Arthrobacter sp. OY3WO11]
MGRYAINGGKVNEEGHGKPWRAFFRTGYIKGLNASQRSAGANMSVDVNLDSTLSFAAALIPTSANVAYIGWMDAVENVTVTAAHATLPRKDRLVAYIDIALITSATTNNQNAFKLMVVAGTAAASPVVPTAGTIQTAIGASNPYIVLADISIAAATTTIVTANITDARTPAALNMPYLWGGSSNTVGHLVPNQADGTMVTTTDSKSVSATMLANGIPVQVVDSSTVAVASGATAVPNDDTIPQITEGTEFLTVSITPKSAANKLVIQVATFMATATVANINAGLFQDAITNAICATSSAAVAANAMVPVVLTHTMTAGTTSPITFRFRAGNGAGSTVTLNGDSGARKFGGVLRSSIVVTEYRA